MALPKHHRLRHRQDFSVVYRHGLSLSSSHLALRAYCRGSSKALGRSVEGRSGYGKFRGDSCSQATQIGVSISQKVSKRAVVRNRLKRQIRAVFRVLLPAIKPGWQLVVVVKPSAIECDYSQFLQELEELLTKAEVLISGY